MRRWTFMCVSEINYEKIGSQKVGIPTPEKFSQQILGLRQGGEVLSSMRTDFNPWQKLRKFKLFWIFSHNRKEKKLLWLVLPHVQPIAEFCSKPSSFQHVYRRSAKKVSRNLTQVECSLFFKWQTTSVSSLAGNIRNSGQRKINTFIFTRCWLLLAKKVCCRWYYLHVVITNS